MLCDRCLSPQGESQGADDHLLRQLAHLYEKQGQPLPQYSVYSSDRILHLAQQKQQLAQTSGAAVVDMEGWAIWQAFPHVAMIRVISDDCQQDLPDISKAIAPNGNLKPITLTQAFLKQPAAAMKLIQGSLQGLHQLTQTAHQLNPHLTP